MLLLLGEFVAGFYQNYADVYCGGRFDKFLIQDLRIVAVEFERINYRPWYRQAWPHAV